VKLLVKLVAAFPARSVNPLAETVYAVLTANELAGVNWIVVEFGTVTVPATAWPPAVTIMAELPTLATLTCSLRPI
jgi:hypothetical protein